MAFAKVAVRASGRGATTATSRGMSTVIRGRVQPLPCRLPRHSPSVRTGGPAPQQPQPLAKDMPRGLPSPCSPRA